LVSIELFEFRSSRMGSSKTSLIPKAVSDGPMARSNTGFDAFPVTINPAIMSLSPVPTFNRVEIFRD
jgi:hypothetical protein